MSAMLKRTAEVASVLTAYCYLLGWQFFASALARFHVDPEEVGITTTWLLIRAVPVAFCIAVVAWVIAGFAFLATRDRKAGAELVNGLFGLLILVAVLGVVLFAYMGLSWLTERAVGHTWPGPRLHDISEQTDVISVVWPFLVFLLVAGVALGVGLWVALETRVQTRIRSAVTTWAQRLQTPDPESNSDSEESSKPESDSQLASGATQASNEPAATSFSRRLATVTASGVGGALQRKSTVPIVVAVVWTCLTYGLAGWAGDSVGAYLSKGNEVTFSPVLNWPEARVAALSADGSGSLDFDECVIKLGQAEGTYVFFIPSTEEVRFVPAGSVIVTVSQKDCVER